jgi:hypothetical protein
MERTGELAPRIHNLVRLAELSALDASKAQLEILSEYTKFCTAGRYMDVGQPRILKEVAVFQLERAKGLLQWLLTKS